ncbi:MAG: NHL repeat-containing protein [Rhodothermales bacterium]
MDQREERPKRGRPHVHTFIPVHIALLLIGAQAALGQPADVQADTAITEAVELATFVEARALAADPSGVLYVVDGGRDVVQKLAPTGAVLATLGGPGAGEGEFDGPTDIDPTNGLVLVVADAGNGRLQRFSRAFLFLEAVPVGSVTGSEARLGNASRYGSARDRLGGPGTGRPTAVAVSPSGETYAISETEGYVIRWDEDRRTTRTIGGYDAGAGALDEPVALAADEASLYVADRGQAAVKVYDAFGGYVRALARGLATDVQALTLTDDALWIVLPRQILIYGLDGRLRGAISVEVGEDLVDAVRVGGVTYVLTRTRLLLVENL